MIAAAYCKIICVKRETCLSRTSRTDNDQTPRLTLPQELLHAPLFNSASDQGPLRIHDSKSTARRVQPQPCQKLG